MGEEVTGYFGRLVPALQTAYGVAWNIEARGESPAIDDRAWQVQALPRRGLFDMALSPWFRADLA